MTGEQLKNVLVQKKVNLSGVARKIGLSPQALNERFKNDDPKYSFVEKVAQAAGMSLAALVQEAEQSLHEAGEGYGVDYREKYIACVEEKSELLQKLVDLQSQVIGGLPMAPAGTKPEAAEAATGNES